jgi:hypothetical protein
MIRRLPPKERKGNEEFREVFLQNFVFFEKHFQKIAAKNRRIFLKIAECFEKVLKFREKSAISLVNDSRRMYF